MGAGVAALLAALWRQDFPELHWYDPLIREVPEAPSRRRMLLAGERTPD